MKNKSILSIMFILLLIVNCSKPIKKDNNSENSFVLKENNNELKDTISDLENNKIKQIDSLLFIDPFDFDYFKYKVNDSLQLDEGVKLKKIQITGYNCNIYYLSLIDYDKKRKINTVNLGKECDSDSDKDTVNIFDFLMTKKEVNAYVKKYSDGEYLFTNLTNYKFNNDSIWINKIITFKQENDNSTD